MTVDAAAVLDRAADNMEAGDWTPYSCIKPDAPKKKGCILNHTGWAQEELGDSMTVNPAVFLERALHRRGYTNDIDPDYIPIGKTNDRKVPHKEEAVAIIRQAADLARQERDDG